MAKTPRSLTGKVVVVTGGARGIGRAIAAALVREGARVTIADLDGAAAEATARELGGGTAGRALDVTDGAAFTALLDAVEREVGPLDVLVNNAGIMPVGALEEEDDASIARQLEINLRAVIHGTRDGMRRMRPRRTGHIVNVASMAGRSGFAHLATYCATKHGVVGLSEAVRLELRGSGVEISVVMPGVVSTELSTGLGTARGVRIVTPEDVAAEVVSALQVPRFDVFVPRSAGWLAGAATMLPRPAREFFVRLLKADQVAVRADGRARAAYEARAAASAPHAEQVLEAEQQEMRAA
jgi:NAD(P)-dependent dehydrogenase (short-subunit alcohol dehydrogenase family)